MFDRFKNTSLRKPAPLTEDQKKAAALKRIESGKFGLSDGVKYGNIVFTDNTLAEALSDNVKNPLVVKATATTFLRDAERNSVSIDETSLGAIQSLIDQSSQQTEAIKQNLKSGNMNFWDKVSGGISLGNTAKLPLLPFALLIAVVLIAWRALTPKRKRK